MGALASHDTRPRGGPRGGIAVSLWAGVAAALAGTLVAAPARGQDDAFPRRKPGLWEVRGVSAQAAGLPPTRYCVGESTDSATSQLDRSVGERGACTLGAFRRAGQAWLAESVCSESKSTVTSRAIASGDFETEYRIDTIVTYDPPLAGVRREDKEAIVATWLGPCEPGQKPGDVVIPGMGTLNMVDGTFRAEAQSRRAPKTKPGRKAANPG